MGTSKFARIAFPALALCASASAADVVTAQQGGVARWSGIAAKECWYLRKAFPAVDAVCLSTPSIYARPGAHQIALWDQDGKQHLGVLNVQKTDFPRVDMPLPDKLDRFLHMTCDDTARAATERTEVAKVMAGNSDKAPRFTLPLGSRHGDAQKPGRFRQRAHLQREAHQPAHRSRLPGACRQRREGRRRRARCCSRPTISSPATRSTSTTAMAWSA